MLVKSVVNTWFLRKPNGEVYGPVEQAELVRWASTARIAPDDEVSSDRKGWISAAKMPGLKLNWMIEWPDGYRAGPYHVSSLGEMLADGKLDGDELVRHVLTQQTASLLETLQSGLMSGELQPGEGALSPALCKMIRGQSLPATPGSNTAAPKPQTLDPALVLPKIRC